MNEALELGLTPDLQERRWQEAKAAFTEAHGGPARATCAYCGARLYGVHTAAVDHFAPKSGVARRVLETGQEVDGGASVEGRKFDGPSGTQPPWAGYTWLAYEWNNFVLCCERCNTGWKRILFPAEADGLPVDGGADRGRRERPLILNPYEQEPLAHLRFEDDGTVLGLTPEGHWTIDALGLNHRAALVQARREKAEDVLDLLSSREPDLAAVVRRGAGDQEHAAVVRCVAEALTGCTWDEIVRAAGVGP